jgi:hypothetical protein
VLKGEGLRVELQQAVHGPGFQACRFSQLLGRSAGRSAQTDVSALGPEDLKQAIDQRSLTDELVALLAKASRPMPLAQLLGKLSAGWVVTEPMLRTVALQDSRLELKGPLLKRA